MKIIYYFKEDHGKPIPSEWWNDKPKGETMKTLILFLLLVLIGFGFLLSENANTHRELASVTASQNQVQAEKQQLLDQLAVNAQTIDRLNQQLTQANQDAASAQAGLEQASREKKELEDRAAVLTMELTGTLQENKVLNEQNAKLAQNNEQLALENTALKSTGSQIAQDQKAFLIPVSGTPSTSKILPTLLISSLPASFAFYAFSRIHRRKQTGTTESSKRKILMQVTEDEVKDMIRMRRSR